MRKLIFLVFWVCCFSSVEAKVTSYLTGNPEDVNPTLYGPVLNIGGGGADVDPAIQWMINKVRGCDSCDVKVDVVVLRASGGNGYNAPIYAMNGVDSVETLVITDRRDSLKTYVVARIQNAEVIFFAGGNQCDYIRLFKGTNIERAVKSVYRRGGAVGGTSAGAMIQGDFVFDGCNGSPISPEVLGNPYHRFISFTYDFFQWNYMQSVLVDTHFLQRDRMGRLMGFLARQIQDGRTQQAWGIGISEATSLVIDQNGIAQVMGNGPVYFVLADHFPEVCQPNQPLTYSNFKIWKVLSGQIFDLNSRPSSGFYQISVQNGSLSGNPY